MKLVDRDPKDYLIRLMSRPLPRCTLRPETALSIEVADAMRRHTLAGRYKGIWGHVSNEGERSQLNGAITKAMGLIAGFPDFVFMWQGGCAVVELKAGKGVLNDNQKDFRAWAVNVGIPWTIARSVAEVEGFLREHGGLE